VPSFLEFFNPQESDSAMIAWSKEILLALLIFVAFWLLGRFVRYFLKHWATRFTSFTETDLDDRILARVAPPLALLVNFAGLYVAVKTLPLPEKVHLIVAGAIFIANVLIVANIVSRILDELLHWYADSVGTRQGGGALDKQIIPLLDKLISIFLYGSALIIVLKHFDYDILSLVTALGIGSLAIGMAAKDTLANMISGFTIMIDRPFRIGDRIKLTESQIGDVVDIGLRSTKIKTADSTLLIVPNATLCNSNVTNLAFPDVRVKGRVNIGVAYGTDVEKVKQLLVEIALQVPELLAEPKPEAYFISFGDFSLNLSLFFWVDDYTRLVPVTDRINSRIITRFREQGIEIPFPTRTVLMEKQG
jgi:small-conductance mechanosensitive channel